MTYIEELKKDIKNLGFRKIKNYAPEDVMVMLIRRAALRRELNRILREAKAPKKEVVAAVVEKQEIINRSVNELYHVSFDWVKENINNMSVWTKKNLATLYFQKGKWSKMISRSEAYSLFCK